MKKLCFACLILLAACQPAPPPSLPEAIQAFDQAFLEADAEVLTMMLPENYVHTNAHSAPFGRESWLNYIQSRKGELESGTLRVNQYEVLAEDIRYHGQTAIVIRRLRSSGIRKGEDFDRTYQITNLWVIEDGRWKRAAFHDTSVPEAP